MYVFLHFFFYNELDKHFARRFISRRALNSLLLNLLDQRGIEPAGNELKVTCGRSQTKRAAASAASHQPDKCFTDALA